MKRIIYALNGTALLLLPIVASAQQFDESGGRFGELLLDVLIFTNNVLIPFILGIGFLFFVWGMFRYFIAGGANEESREKGRNIMIYATLGFVLIIIFWGIINILTDGTGLAGDRLQDTPTVIVEPPRN